VLTSERPHPSPDTRALCVAERWLRGDWSQLFTSGTTIGDSDELTLIAYAHLVLAGKLTDREAAEAVGISPGHAAYVKGKARVREYMASHRASVRAGLVQHEIDALAEFNIGREQILIKWWEFATIDPKLTGYNTSGQSKALDSLWKALGSQRRLIGCPAARGSAGSVLQSPYQGNLIE
jgi:hypothetical protein